MNVAIPHWQGRVSPVFDVAVHVLIVEIHEGAERSRQMLSMDKADPRARAGALHGKGVDLLVCAAITRPMRLAVLAEGIELIDEVCGEVDEIISAVAAGRFQRDTFRMPGCCRRRRRMLRDSDPRKSDV
ncbi:MAG: NifB/NifX family molybdenum-iron cluster-binding protein [Phycisphaerae bacterium]